MAAEPKMIEVLPGSEVARLLDEAGATPLVLVRDGVRYRLDRENDSIWAGYDPATALAGIRAAAGSWRDLDTEALKLELYRAREEGTRLRDRP